MLTWSEGRVHRARHKTTEEYREDKRDTAKQPTSHAPASEKWYGFEGCNKNHWALSFLRWLSFLPPGGKGKHKILLRLRKSGKPASRTQDKKFPVDVSCGVPGIYFSSLKLHSVQRKQAASNGLCDRQRDWKSPMPRGFRWHFSHSLEFTNSHHSLRPGSLASNGKYFIPDPSRWSPESKRTDYHYLQGNTVIYGAKLAIISSLVKSPMLPCRFPYKVFLILKTVFYFTADKKDSGWHMAQEGPMGYILPRASMVGRKTHSS